MKYAKICYTYSCLCLLILKFVNFICIIMCIYAHTSLKYIHLGFPASFAENFQFIFSPLSYVRNFLGFSLFLYYSFFFSMNYYIWKSNLFQFRCIVFNFFRLLQVCITIPIFYVMLHTLIYNTDYSFIFFLLALLMLKIFYFRYGKYFS